MEIFRYNKASVEGTPMSNDAFLILFLILLAFMTLFPLLFRKFQVPEVITLLVIGMIIGPNGIDLIGWLSPKLTIFGGDASKINEHAVGLINTLGSLGLMFLMSLAGMEADFKLINTSRKPVVWLSIFTFTIPAVSGFLIYKFFEADDLPGQLLYASLFASHSVGIVFPVIRSLNLSRTIFGVAVLITTIITDILSILLLAVSVQMKKVLSPEVMSNGTMHKTMSIFDYLDPGIFGNWFFLVFLCIVVIYFAGVLFVTPKLGRLILRLLPNGEDSVISCFLFVVLLSVIIGELLGINLVVGAFLAGLGLSRVVKTAHVPGAPTLFDKLEGIGYGLLIPFLFLSIGMKTDFTILFHSMHNLTIILLTVAGLVGSKVFSGWAAMRISGFGNAKGFCAGMMTVPQLSATLAAAAIGKDLGMLSDNFFNAIIVLSIVTTLPVPNIVRWIIGHYKLNFVPIGSGKVTPFEVPESEESDELL